MFSCRPNVPGVMLGLTAGRQHPCRRGPKKQIAGRSRPGEQPQLRAGVKGSGGAPLAAAAGRVKEGQAAAKAGA